VKELEGIDIEKEKEGWGIIKTLNPT